MFVSGIDSVDANDTNGSREIDSGGIRRRGFDVGTTFDLDANIGDGTAAPGTGSWGTSRRMAVPSRRTWSSTSSASNSCHVNGFAIGG